MRPEKRPDIMTRRNTGPHTVTISILIGPLPVASVVELRSLPPRVCGCELNLVLRNLVSVQSRTFVDQGRLVLQYRGMKSQHY